MRVELSRFIESDLNEIVEWIANDSPQRALSFIKEIREAFARIGAGPLKYQLRPELGADARLAVVERYVVLFRISGEAIRIERVVFGGRDLQSLL